jgi:hypothetical protein
MQEDEKVALRVTNESKTIIDSLEGNAIIEYKYKDEASFEEVYNESFTKGEVKTEDGKFPSPSEGKEVEEVKIKITPSNYPFYNSREDSAVGEKMRKLIDSGKFELFSSVERNLKYRKEVSGEALTGKVDELRSRKGGS